MSVAKELYRFVEGDSDFIYTVTSADSADEYDAGSGLETYEPVAIGRNEVQNKGDISKDKLTISFASDSAVARKWFTSSLDFPLTLTIFNKDEDGVEIEWKGRLAGTKPTKTAFEFNFESIFTSLRRPGLRQRYQVTCPHLLYGPGCNLDKEDFAYSGAITDVSGNIITIDVAGTQADGFFSSGIFEDNAGNLRFITSHKGSELTLIRPMIPLIDFVDANGYVGLTGRVFPGCARSTAACKDKFDNINNFGGFPFIPQNNPFSGNSIV